jgi:hypothetical protein
MQRPDELTFEEIRTYLGSQTRPEQPPAHVRAYRAAAAVLAAIRDPERLRPLGDAPPGKATELLGPDLIPATGAAFNGQVMLAPEVRAATIKDLLTTGQVETALAANPAERDSLLQTHLERYLHGDAPPVSTQTIDELDATLQVSVWLADVVEGVPPVTKVTARAGYQRLLAPFETLASDAVFRGRRRELDHLRRYIGVLAPESAIERVRGKVAQWTEPEQQPAVSISGIGGAGKSSLVARFMLEHTRLPEQSRIPFAYLDFARTSLDVGDPVGLSAEMLRQLDMQFPSLGLSRGFGFLDDWRPGSGVERAPEPTDQLAKRALSVLADILGILGSRLRSRPFVMVLDSFEEVQHRGEERAFPLWDLLSDLQVRWPFLRVVVAGRAPVDTLRLADHPPQRIELSGLDDEAARSFLAAQGIGDPDVQRELIATFGRLPLSLKLIGSLAARTPGGAPALLADGNGLSLLAASDEIAQAQLYGRFLDHITDERIRRVAHPGLTLRRLNPALILEVLNRPCGLAISTMDEATALFEALQRESSLVSVDSDDGDLVHRPDLRRVMLKMLLAAKPAVAEQIHRCAVDWYTGRQASQARAEWAYHRLQLGLLDLDDALRDREVRASIQAAIEELPVQAQLWLAAQGLRVPEETLRRASRDEQHSAIAARIEDLLPYEDSALDEADRIFQTAYASLREDRSRVRNVVRSALGQADRGASPVFRAGARIAAQRGDDEQALDLIEQGLERAAKDGSAELTLPLLRERAWLCRERPAAEQAEGLRVLAEHAQRHEDLAARIQHRAQTVRGEPGMADSTDLAALFDLLSQASPEDVWDLLPAIGRAVTFAVGWSPDDSSLRIRSVPGVSPFALAEPLAACVRATASPFRTAVFPGRQHRSALSDVLRDSNFDSSGISITSRGTDVLGTALRAALGRGTAERVLETLAAANQGAGQVSDDLRFATRAVFLSRFLRLYATWPYRVLSVAAPQGRRGEQLTVR